MPFCSLLFSSVAFVFFSYVAFSSFLSSVTLLSLIPFSCRLLPFGARWCLPLLILFSFVAFCWRRLCLLLPSFGGLAQWATPH
jgi:hypothetical protein